MITNNHSWVFPLVIDKLILKFMYKFKRPKISKAILKKKNKVGGLTLISELAIVVKIVWSWHKDRHPDQWEKAEILEINPNFQSFDFGQKILFNK